MQIETFRGARTAKGIFIGGRDGLFIEVNPAVGCHARRDEFPAVDPRMLRECGISAAAFASMRRNPLVGKALHGAKGPLKSPFPAHTDDPNKGIIDGGDWADPADANAADTFERMADEHEKAGRTDDAKFCRAAAAKLRSESGEASVPVNLAAKPRVRVRFPATITERRRDGRLVRRKADL
jgi:hypothetical protein